MTASRSILDMPVDRAVRLVAQGFVEQAGEARDRLAAGSDPSSLHDFRVAMRRLRSWLRGFQPHVLDGIRKRARRPLADISDATSARRDAEVHAEWLARHRRRLPLRQRAALDALVVRLSQRAIWGSRPRGN